MEEERIAKHLLLIKPHKAKAEPRLQRYASGSVNAPSQKPPHPYARIALVHLCDEDGVAWLS